VAVTAVGVQVAPRPRLQRLGCVRRIYDAAFPRRRGGVERRQRRAVLAGPADVPRLREGDELVAPIGPRPVQLLGQEGEGVLRLVVVTQQTLAAAVELPEARPRTAGVAHFLLGAV